MERDESGLGSNTDGEQPEGGACNPGVTGGERTNFGDTVLNERDRPGLGVNHPHTSENTQFSREEVG